MFALVDAALKAELAANRTELLRHLMAPDPLRDRLADMYRDPVSGALVHPELHAVPSAALSDVHDARTRRNGLPVTAIVLKGTEREVVTVAATERLPANCVLWDQPRGCVNWLPGPAHALWHGPARS
jgi:hypothetical protein